MNSHLGRRAFSPMELHALFHGYVYGDEKQKREQPKHWHFWLPLFAYYTGAYSDEIGHLTLENLTTRDGIEGFEFTTNEKILPRFIPIHSALWQAGLEDYLEFVSEQHQERLLFDLPSKVNRYSEKVRIWFSGEGERLGYLQKCGLPNIDQQGLKTAISSLRLNFEQQLRIHAIQAGQKPLYNYLMGYRQDHSLSEPNSLMLQHIVEPLRNINSKAHWQRFIARQNS
ncbi:putative orphan protein [Pseudoalteromonas luteoviolacea B = ATCC 29581]|nr:putative orphan protein [Pseudoalteromonas luteoviolacea B = ATCC 29581]